MITPSLFTQSTQRGSRLKFVSALFVLGITTIFYSGNTAMAYEEAHFVILSKTDNYEIRQYEDRVAVETESSSANNGFRTLFKYISGANTAQQEIAMTIPVTQSVKIDMTVPVTQQKNGSSDVMQFYLPATFTAQSAPKPTSPNVRIVTIKGGIFAVRRYSGRSSDSNFQNNSDILRSAMIADGVTFEEPAIKATFNGPLTPFFLRRNEVMFRLSD